MPYYPAQTLVMAATTIRRERRLPPDAISDNPRVREGTFIEANDILLSGVIPANYIVLDVLKPLGLKNTEMLTPDTLLVRPGRQVHYQDELIVIGEGRRAKRFKSPVDAVFLRMDGGDMILQSDPEPVELPALYPGRITSLRNNASIAVIEATGALIQGVWGNGKSAYCQLRPEPKDGIESLKDDSLVNEYRGTAIVMLRPIKTREAFDIAQRQNINAIIAPSMHSDLREVALKQSYPVLLMEGFGEMRMSDLMFTLLRDNQGRPATINAVEPSRWSIDRPEVLVTLPTSVSAPLANMDQPLVEGALVRITRSPQFGMAGRVKRLVEAPRTVDNGLRLPGAEVTLPGGETVFVPLANLEILGRPIDRTRI